MPTERPRRSRSGLVVAALLALAGVAAVVAFQPGRRDVEVVRTDEEHAASGEAPRLAEAPGATPPGTTKLPARRPGSAPEEGDPVPEEAEAIVIEGTVLDDATGRPLEGATVYLRVADPGCPSPPDSFFDDAAPGSSGAMRLTMSGEQRIASVIDVRAKTGAGGRFSAAWVAGVDADVYARHPGYVPAGVCRHAPPTPVTLRLREGAAIEGVVSRNSGEPILGAKVECVPDPAMQGVLGHRDVTKVGERGEFALRGLLPGPVRVTASHPKFVPTTSEPVEPGLKGLRLVLVPAFLVTLRLAPDDAKEPEAPTAEWRADGAPPLSDLVMLQRAGVPRVPDAPETGPVLNAGGLLYEPLAIPCDRRTVTFTVKAMGYAPWTSDPIEIPRDGGEATLDVPLRHDPDLGRLIVHVENESGQPLSWTGEGCEAEVGRRDGRPVPGGIVLQAGERLDLPALPSGPYAVRILSPKHAPARLEATVPAGGIEETRVRLGPPAQLRVKFTAPDPLIVRFRLLQGRETARFYVEGDTGPEDPNAPPGEQSFQIGAGQVVLTGLATGRYTVEVISPDLTAPATGVDLVEGEAKDLEIAVSLK